MKLRLAAMVLVLVLFVATGCSSDDAEPAENPGGEENPEPMESSRGAIGVLWRDGVTVHPLLGWPRTGANPALSLAHPTLARIDQSGEISPHLAEDIVFTGNREISIHLPGTVSWSDGHPLTAGDILFGLEILLHPDFSAAEPEDALDFVRGAGEYADGEAEEISGVKVVSDSELRIRLDYSTPRALWIMSRLSPLPRHALEDVAAADLDEALTDLSLPVAGEYRLAERREESHSTLLSLERISPSAEEVEADEEVEGDEEAKEPGEEDDITDGDGEEPTEMPDILDYHFAEDASTEVTDELDVFHIPADSPRDSERPGAGWTRIATLEAEAVEYLGFNPRNEFLADSRVRRALAYAVDREEAVQLMFGDRGVSAAEPLGALMPDFEGARGVEYDPKRARELLEEAGYGEGGKRTPELYLLYPRDGSGREQVAEAIAAGFSEVGITLHPISADESSLLYTVFGRERYDMYLLALPLDVVACPTTWGEDGLLEYGGEYPEDPSFEFMLYEPRSPEHWDWLSSIIDDYPVTFLGYPRGAFYVRDDAPAFLPWRSPVLGNIGDWPGFFGEGN
ncbi:MAG: ABC transporter substrate-binding protein [Bacillota bacterium]